MKKTLTVITLLAGAVSGYSQGEILFDAYDGTLSEAVYNQQTAANAVNNNTVITFGNYTTLETVGNSATTTTTAESPAGTQAYGAGTALSGTGYSEALLVGPGGISTPNGTVMENGTPVGLTPFGGSTSAGAVPAPFYTGPKRLIGFSTASSTITLPTQSYYAGGSSASVALVAWNNEGGTITSLAAAQAAGDPWGMSPVVQMSALPVSPAGAENIPATLQSFSLGVAAPEPSTIALGVMGVSALLFRRRK